MSANRPPSAAKAFNLVRNVIGNTYDIPEEKKYNGNGGPGRLLEDLLGAPTNNLDAPDLNDWELKFHGGNALLTLFHKDPEPKGAINELVHYHGWKDDHNRLSFRHTLGTNSHLGFYVENAGGRITLKNDDEDSPKAYWAHDTLMNAIGAKLRRVILVSGKVHKKERRVSYESANAYWEINISSFCESVASCLVRLDFDARTKADDNPAIRNHGTKFRIKASDMGLLYKHHEVITK